MTCHVPLRRPLLQIIASRRATQFASCYLADCGISPELKLRVRRNARHALKVQSRNTPETSVDLLLFISEPVRSATYLPQRDFTGVALS